LKSIHGNVERKHVRRIMRSGGHQAFGARCEAAVADGYREFGADLGATGQRRESAMHVGMMMVFILPGTPFEVSERGLRLSAKKMPPVLKAQSAVKTRDAAE
jgi:hypothetical protein